MLSLVRQEEPARVEIRHTGKGRFAVFVDDKRVTPMPLTRGQAETEAVARGWTGAVTEEPQDAMLAAARAVPKPADLVLAERIVRELLNRQTAIQKKIRDLHRERVPPSAESARRKIAIEREIEELRAEEVALKPRLREAFLRAGRAREPYAEAMRAALRPYQLTAFDRIEVIAVNLAAEIAALNMVEDELRTAGAELQVHWWADLSGLLQRVERARRP